MSDSSSNLPATLARTLDQVRKGQLVMKLAEFPVLLVGGIAAAGMFQAIADRVFDLPWGVRAIFFLADLAAIGWLAWRFVWTPWRRRLDRKGAALLVERGVPELRSSLISTVELAGNSNSVSPQSQLLVKQLIADTVAEVERLPVLKQVIRPDRVKKLALWSLAPLVPALLLLVLGWPMSGLLVKRILLSNQAFPSDTRVESVTEDLIVKEGDEVTLTAIASGVVPTEGRLVLIREGKPDEKILVSPVKSGASGFTATLKNVREGFQYRFELNDGVGRKHSVTVHSPPAVKGLRFVQTFPAYARLRDEEMKPGPLKLLEGSTLRVEGGASKPLGEATLTLVRDGAPVKFRWETKTGETSFIFRLPESDLSWKSLTIHLTGAEGDESMRDPIYPIQVIADRPPQLSLLTPKGESITAVASETIAISGNVSDDYGLAWVGMHYRILRPSLDGGFDEVNRGQIQFPVKGEERSSAFRQDWNLGQLNPALTAGTRVVFWIEARDTNPANGRRSNRDLPPGMEPGTSRTPERTITIVSEEQKRMELLEEFGRKAADLERLYDTQKEINERINARRR